MGINQSTKCLIDVTEKFIRDHVSSVILTRSLEYVESNGNSKNVELVKKFIEVNKHLMDDREEEATAESPMIQPISYSSLAREFCYNFEKGNNYESCLFKPIQQAYVPQELYLPAQYVQTVKQYCK